MEKSSQTQKFFLQIFIYSKDRPFQLQQLLATLFKYGLSQHTEIGQENRTKLISLPLYFNIQLYCAVNVYYTYSQSLFGDRYKAIESQFQSVNFIEEDKTMEQLQSTIRMTPISESVNFFTFMVDDMVFFNHFNLSEILFKLYSDHQLYSVHLKLYPGINYSHTTDKIINIPKFQAIDQNSMKYLKFRRSEGEFDWNYPFDFCGSIYALESVIEVMDKIEDKQKMLKPNTFEYIGNITIKKNLIAKDKQYCMCLNYPVMTVITVNKVQEIYDTPIYKFTADEEEKKESDKNEEEDVLLIMNNYFDEGQEYDVEGYYAKQQFNSVHIGDFKLKKGKETKDSRAKIAVIMPVYNDHEFLEESIKSILCQTFQDYILIIINDGSTEQKVAQVLKQYEKDGKIIVKNLEQNKGLSHALNYGINLALEMADVKYIARMDSDDISLPLRLEYQYNFMELNPSVDVIGSAVQIFGDRKEQRIITYPGQDELIKFLMAFYCNFAHPTIFMRASSIKEHNLRYEHGKMEDYRLWLTSILDEKIKFGNIGITLLKLRKHQKNYSNNHTIEDEVEIKMPLILRLLADNENLCQKLKNNLVIINEFINITGREIKNQEVFRKLQFKQELSQIFEQMIKYYQSQELQKQYKEYIVRSLQDRKAELAMYAVANDLDTDMLKCLLQGGQLKKLMGKQQ